MQQRAVCTGDASGGRFHEGVGMYGVYRANEEVVSPGGYHVSPNHLFTLAIEGLRSERSAGRRGWLQINYKRCGPWVPEQHLSPTQV